MAKQTDWSKAVTPDIRKNMETSARAAYDNGCLLRADALFLFKADRYPRAAALAILAEEEFSKAFILLICAANGRWDSNIFASLRKHSNKQGISEAMLEYLEWLKKNFRRVEELNRFAFVQAQPSIYPGEEKWGQILGTAKSRFSKPVRDFFKQDAFYVSIDEEAKLKSTPNSVSQAEADRCLNDSEKLQAVTEVLLGVPNAAEKYAQL